MRSCPVVVAALLCALVSACGGGGGGPAGGPEETVVLRGDPAREGSILSTGLPLPSASGLFVGDTSTNVSVRAFVSFPLVGIPAGATVVAARLEMAQGGVFGSPYAELGNLIVDHVDLGLALESLDYVNPAIRGEVGTLTFVATLGVYGLDVGERVQADLDAGRTRSEYRLLFEVPLSLDGGPDGSLWVDSADAGASGAPPRLTVTFAR